MKLVLFDIDSTLIQSGGSAGLALELAFQDKFDSKDKWFTFSFHGLTDLAIIRRIFNEKLERDPKSDELDDIVVRYTEHLKHTLQGVGNYKILPFVQDTLDKLMTCEDVALGLATGNLEKTGRYKLARGNLNHYFKFGGFSDDSEDRAELTKKGIEKGIKLIGQEPSEVFVIGDTIYDVRAGKAAGAKVIGVATGPVGVDVLLNEGADYVMEDMSGCLGVLGI
jgi:phosphoglycolate phosphatase